MQRPDLRARAQSLFFSIAALIVPGAVPFGMIDREHPPQHTP